MPTGTIVSSWTDGDRTYAAVSIPEPQPTGPAVNTEYIVSVPTDDLATMTAAEKRAAVAAQVKAQRDAIRKPPVAANITGTVTV